LPLNGSLVFYLTQCLLFHYIGKENQAKYELKYVKKNLKKETSTTILTVTWSMIIRFQWFLANIFLT